MNYRLLPAVCLAAAISATSANMSAVEYNDPPSTYPGMESLEPDSDNLSLCQGLPLFENFSNPDHYDGNSSLPIGWASTGSAVWRTAAMGSLPAASGDYYMIIPESNMPRDERAYTPFFLLEKGVTYTITFMTHQEGTTINGVSNTNTINLRVGTQQDSEFTPVSIASISKNNKSTEWDEHAYTFSPAETGAYCFCFELRGVAYSGFAAVDKLRITSPTHPENVEPLFHPLGIFSLDSSAIISMGNAPVRMAQYVNNGAPVAWMSEGLFTEMLDNGDGNVYFDNSGVYDVTLQAANVSSEKQLTKAVKVDHYNDPGDGLYFASYDPATAKLLGRGDIPAFSSDPNGLDYITGPNHYYSTFAEYIPVPEAAQLTISSIGFRLTNLRYTPTNDYSDMKETVRLKFYGTDEYGRPDDSNVIASFNYTMEKFFGTSLGSLNGDEKNIKLPRPVNVTGPFFIALEYSESILIDPVDPNIGRSYASISVAKHVHNRTTLFCKPYKVPPFTNVELDEWCPVSDLNPALAGSSAAFNLHASYVPGHLGVCMPEVESSSVCRVSGRHIIIDTPAEAEVSVYSLDGIKAAGTHAAAGRSVIDASSLSTGIYIVRVGNDIFRIAVK